MYARLLTLLVLTALFAGPSLGRVLARQSSADAPAITLVPEAVGGWQRTAQWLYPRGMGEYQEYGRYAQAGRQATLSFDHDRGTPHNAINCFAGRDDPVGPQTVQTLSTADGSARFNVARFDAGGKHELVAVSVCSAGGCVENPPAPGWGDVLRPAFWSELLRVPSHAAIPLSISLVADAPVPDAVLDAALVDFVAHLDLRAVRARGAAAPAS